MSKSPFKIEKDVPIPTNRLPPMPFSKMKLGESFEVELTKPSDKATIRQRIVRWQKANPGKRLSMIQMSEHKVRIFRVRLNQTPPKVF